MKRPHHLGTLAFACALALAFVAVTANPAAAQTTKWVDQADGDNSNDGNSEGTAYATLQFAIDNSVSGTAGTPSVINVKDGTYGITGQTNGDCNGGFATAILIDGLDYLTIQAFPGHEPVVKPALAANIVSISVKDSDHLIVDNIDSDQTVAQFDNWHVCNSDDLTVRNSTFEGGEDGIDFNTALATALIENNEFTNINTGSGDEVLDFSDAMASNVTIQDNLFLNNYRHIRTGAPGVASDMIIRRNTMNGTVSEEAIRLIGAAGVLIENNVILNNRQQGIYIDTGCSDITVRHNTFFNNDQEAGGNGEIRTKVFGSDIVIKNNILYGNGSNPAIETTVSSLPGEDYNLTFKTVDTFTFGSNTTTGSDPLFVSTTPGSEDLHLQDGSPAIAAGTPLGVTEDLDGNPRPDPAGSDPDAGAYEKGIPAPRLLVQGVLADLNALLPSGDEKTDKRIEKAVKHLEHSLADELWENDSHLTKKGKKVFDEDKKAAHELEKVEGVDVSALVDALVDADRQLAQTAVTDALSFSGVNQKELAKAQEELLKGDVEALAERPDKAIDHYKKAWEHAQKAMKKATA